MPATPAKYTPSSVIPYASIDLIKEWVTLKVTATQDPSSATSVDLIATGTGTPANLVKLLPGGGVDFIIDGDVINAHPCCPAGPFPFNSNGVAAHIASGARHPYLQRPARRWDR